MAEVADDAARDKAIRRYGELEERFVRARRVRRRERGRPHLREPRPARAGADPAAAHAVRRAAPPRRARPHPVRRVRHRVRDRTPRCCSTSPPTTSTPTRSAGCGLPAESHRRPRRHQPQRRTARRRRQPGVVPRRRARRGRRLQHGLAEVPRRPRHRRTASPPRTRQRREEGVRAAHAGRQDGRQGHQSRCGTEHAAPRRADDRPRWTRSASPTRWPGSGSPPRPSCGRTPLVAKGLTKTYGSLEVFTGVDLAIDRGSRVVVLGLNGAGKTTLLRLLAGVETADAGALEPGHGLKLGLLRAGARHPRRRRDGVGEHPPRRTRHRRAGAAQPARRVHVHRSAARSAGRHAVRWREDAARAGRSGRVDGQRAAARRAHQQPRPRVTRAGARRAAQLPGARWCWCTHDPGAAEALDPQRVVLLPDGTEDYWSDDYRDLIELA